MAEPFLTPMPLIVAHRGDSRHYPENTIEAFVSAVAMGVDVIETDVHISKDGQIVIWHDPTLERNTDGTGRIEDYTVAELKRFDAGYTFTPDHGTTWPFRGKQVKICLLGEALEACPNQRFNIDLKSADDAIVEAFIRTVDEHEAASRVLCASFHLKHLKRMRVLRPDILTSITTIEVLKAIAGHHLHLLPKVLHKERTTVFQVPVRQWGIEVITESFVSAVHKRNGVVQVWTINDAQEMRRLWNLGVDSIMTDDPATAIETAVAMGLRRT
ncbi:MAG: glycerophosphodiester phosphodiesterase [Sphaerochaetaceae bacterium]|jgi:glycerophosphoryl diester phosphodiesterase|nr:glycerophosphodiester phosphodiesterase [Sphaerochaetaceae bacterium]NLV84821.1 glycerophosphodiester phosphodiesterase [Spirochaetales bacterium]